MVVVVLGAILVALGLAILGLWKSGILVAGRWRGRQAGMNTLDTTSSFVCRGSAELPTYSPYTSAVQVCARQHAISCNNTQPSIRR